jgi:membrane protein
MQIKAILFDLDGTLVDSNDMHVKAWQEAFGGIGVYVDRQAVHEQIGKGADNLVPALLPQSSEAERESLGDDHGKAFKSKYLEQVKAFPEARNLLIRVRDAGQKVVFASSAPNQELAHYIDLLDAEDIIAETTCADDVKRTKPAPDIFATALEKIAPITAAEVIVVGDTSYDVEAAAKCGAAAVGLRSEKFTDKALRDAGAIALYDDVADLLANFGSSPLARY